MAAHTIAFAGKGGVGKTTICGMLVDTFASQGKGPMLVVDADPNANLNEVLGIEITTTLGDIREEVAGSSLSADGPLPAGVNKADYMEMKFADALVEEDDYDFLVMGKTQGAGCYCYVNGLLTTQINKYMPSYKYLVVDNEAGLEHISRGILPHIDTLILVSDSSRRGVQAVAKIAAMVEGLKLNPKQMGLIINRAPGGELNDGVKEEIEKYGLKLFGVLPQDEDVFDYDCEGRPSSSLPSDNPVKKKLKEIIGEIF